MVFMSWLFLRNYSINKLDATSVYFQIFHWSNSIKVTTINLYTCLLMEVREGLRRGVVVVVLVGLRVGRRKTEGWLGRSWNDDPCRNTKNTITKIKYHFFSKQYLGEGLRKPLLFSKGLTFWLIFFFATRFFFVYPIALWHYIKNQNIIDT